VVLVYGRNLCTYRGVCLLGEDIRRGVTWKIKRKIENELTKYVRIQKKSALGINIGIVIT
jgi:ribosomal protein L7Ae-like RNA K-turn-binding protein